EFTGSPRRKEIPEIPFEALREAVLNAVIHRDYFEKGANIMVEIFADRLEITSPGGLPKGLKPEDFGKRSVLRNPNVANLFQRIEYIEKMGTGIRRIQKMMSDAGMPLVIYRWDTFVKAVFLLERKKESGKTSGKILDIISDNPNITIPEISEMLGITERSAQRNMHNLQKDGKIKRIGSRKTGYWQIIREK
ncbi:AAA family ATPase, partial [candidate division KSB1 bacterium 4572_119]